MQTRHCSALTRIGLVLAVAGSLALPEISTAQTLAAFERERLRGRDKTFKRLNDCEAVPVKTIDVLRHGWAITNQDEILEKKAASRQVGQALASGLFGILQDSGIDLPYIPLSFGRLEVEPPTRAKYRDQLEDDFRKWVLLGGRKLCTERARDVAWSYAPAIPTECENLPTEPIDTLRSSGEFYWHDRSAVRLEVLNRYREAVQDGWSGTCADFLNVMVGEAWVLDP